MLTTLAGDLRHAARMLRRSPVFAAVSVVVISLGTGAVTTIYTVMNALLLRPVPGTSGGARLAGYELTRQDGERQMTGSYGWYEHLRDRSRIVEGLAAWTRRDLTIAVGGEGTASTGALVTGNYFSVLGVRPALGRFFTSDEGASAADPVVVLSHGTWETRFGADSGIIGRSVSVNGRPFTVIGIAPRDFRGLVTVLQTDAWVPVAAQTLLDPDRDLRTETWFRVVARVRPGVSLGEVQAEASGLTLQHAAQSPEGASARQWTGTRVTPLRALPADARGPFMGFLGIMLGAAGLVLLIASVNVASMLSARAIARRREMALRTALGAGRGRLVRQLLTETVVLFVLGAGGGAMVALTAARGLERLRVPIEANLSLSLPPDLRVFAFTLLVSLATGLAFGLSPALQASRRDITTSLRDDSSAAGTRRGFTGNALIVGQLAVSLVLLVSAGLFLRALASGGKVEPGFDARGVVAAHFQPVAWGYDEAKARAFFERLRAEAAALPGATGASFADNLPLTASNSSTRITPDGVDLPRADVAGASDGAGGVRVPVSYVGAGYFQALRLLVVQGRPIEAADDGRAARVAVVNETLARRYWADRGALGRTFTRDGERFTIVGVARDSRFESLSEPIPSFVYLPIEQVWMADRWLIVRTAGSLDDAAAALRRLVESADASLPRAEVRPLAELNTIVLFPQRIGAIVTATMGALGLLLAAIGLYGIISYSASRRTREIGVRVALGAARRDVLRMVVGEGVRLALAGVVIGLLLSAIAARLIAGFLFNVNPLDLATFAGMPLVFLAVAALASYLPARRAAAGDPMIALRSE